MVPRVGASSPALVVSVILGDSVDDDAGHRERKRARQIVTVWGRIAPILTKPYFAVLVYALCSLAANWPAWPGNPDLMRQGDMTGTVFGLYWTPFALVHDLNPFYSNWINASSGTNFAENLTAPLFGLLLAPLSFSVNAVASLNVLNWLGFFLSASAMYFVVRSIFRSKLAPFLAGLLYGFSPYMVGQGYQHTLLTLVPLPPLIFKAAFELLVRRTERSYRWGLVLGLAVAIQYLTQPEIAFTCVVVLTFAVATVAVAHRGQAREVARRSWRAGVLALGVTMVITAYPIWVGMAGPYHYAGATHAMNVSEPGGGLATDLIGPLVPTTFMRFAPHALETHGNTLTSADYPENGSYLGIPLLVLLASAIYRCRRDRWMRFLTWMMAGTFLASLGGILVINNHVTSLRLPISLVADLPGFYSLESSRFALYVVFFAALILARALDLLFVTTADASPAVTAWRSPRRRRMGMAVAALLGVASVLTLLPRWPYGVASTDTPAFFTSSAAVDRIPFGSVALVAPYPSVFNPSPELWQTLAHLQFKILGGYEYFAAPDGQSSITPDILQPVGVEEWLSQQGSGTPYPGTIPVPAFGRSLVLALQSFIRQNHVGVVIVRKDVSLTPGLTFRAYKRALGRPTLTYGNVALWTDVQKLVAPDRTIPKRAASRGISS